MKLRAYLLRRLIFLLPQLLGILAVTFIIVRMMPGDPARIMAGPLVPDEGVELIRKRMGLIGPLPYQFIHYVKNVFQGDLGNSWVTGNPVMRDIMVRLPATLELIVLALLVSLFIMLPIGIKSVSFSLGEGSWGKKLSGKTLFGYGMTAGAFPDFWLSLILIFVFYAVLGWAPAPIGQLDIGVLPPPRITGMYVVDSLLVGNWAAFTSSLTRLILPVFVLAFVYGGSVIKVAIVTARDIQGSGFVNFAKVCGLPAPTIQKYVTRSVYPPVATIVAVNFGFLIGGAALVESVFSWGGFGQYAIQSVINSDFAAVQGVVLVSAIINLIAYFLVDMVYYWVDPRIKTLG